MSLKVTGVDWESFELNEGRPIVMGIEGMMVCVFLELREKNRDSWNIIAVILRVIADPAGKKPAELSPGKTLRGSLRQETPAEKGIFGQLELVE